MSIGDEMTYVNKKPKPKSYLPLDMPFFVMFLFLIVIVFGNSFIPFLWAVIKFVVVFLAAGFFSYGFKYWQKQQQI